jgi:hypothetical protein
VAIALVAVSAGHPAGNTDGRTATAAEGTSVYQTGHVDRQVDEIRALVQPGGSGGPLLSPSGTVDGRVQDVDWKL